MPGVSDLQAGDSGERCVGAAARRSDDERNGHVGHKCITDSVHQLQGRGESSGSLQ